MGVKPTEAGRVVVDGDGTRRPSVTRCPCLVVVTCCVGVSLPQSRVVRDCYDALVDLAFSSGLAMAMKIGGGRMRMEL